MNEQIRTPNPFNAINLHGEGVMRGVTLPLPLEQVRNLLPAGLEPGPQNVTPPGTHPVIMFYQDLFRGRMSVPTLLPSLTYYEHSVGIPYSYMSAGSLTPGHPGPYYFMPRLFLNNILATMGGVLFWGLAKRLAAFQVSAGRYAMDSTDGLRLTCLSWKPGEYGPRPVAQWPHFEPLRQMLDQPLISLVPGGAGPFFILSDFDRNWDVATLQPLETVVDIDVEYVTGLPSGRYPHSGWSPGLDESPLGSFELRTPWRLSLPYPPLLSFRS